MTSFRLLPVVIFAAIALLLLKGVGLLTTGGYVLTGPALAVAASGAAAPTEATAPTLLMPPEPTLEDTSPVLKDNAPTMGGIGQPADTHGAAPAKAHDAAAAMASTGHGEAPAEAAADGIAEGAAEGAAAALSVASVPDTLGDAIPMETDANGNLLPLGDGTSPSEKRLLERLAQRRAELDALAKELKLREDLVEAAERRIEERTAALTALETRITAMVEQKKAADEGQFNALVKMYEGMKPADAAAIFDALDINVLVRLARSINPRKMAPIMAKMDEKRAQELTVRLANEDTEPAVELGAMDLASLPQIVGQ